MEDKIGLYSTIVMLLLIVVTIIHGFYGLIIAVVLFICSSKLGHYVALRNEDSDESSTY